MAIVSNYLKKKGKLAKDTVVATVMSNLGLHKYARDNGLELIQTKVGDRYVLEEMLKDGYPQVLINAKVNSEKKYDYDKDSEIKDAIEKLEKEFAGNGRVLIRPSGTEPLVRVMIEGEDQKYITQKAKEIAKLIEEKLK